MTQKDKNEIAEMIAAAMAQRPQVPQAQAVTLMPAAATIPAVQIPTSRKPLVLDEQYKPVPPANTKPSDTLLIQLAKQHKIHDKGQAPRPHAPTMARDLSQALQSRGLTREQAITVMEDAKARGVLVEKIGRKGFRMYWTWDEYRPLVDGPKAQSSGENLAAAFGF